MPWHPILLGHTTPPLAWRPQLLSPPGSIHCCRVLPRGAAAPTGQGWIWCLLPMFSPFSPGSQQEMWEEKQQQTPLELLHPSVSSVVPDGAGSCAGHRAMWAHRGGYGRLGRALPPQPVQPVFRAAASRMPIGSLSLFSGHLFPLGSLVLCLLFWAWFFA